MDRFETHRNRISCEVSPLAIENGKYDACSPFFEIRRGGDEDGGVSDISGDAPGGDTCLRLRTAPTALAEADAACGLITSAPACPTLSHTTTLVGTTQLQKSVTSLRLGL